MNQAIVTIISYGLATVLVLLIWRIIYLTRALAKARIFHSNDTSVHDESVKHLTEVNACYSALRVLALMFLAKYPFEKHEKPLIEWIEAALSGDSISVEENNTLYTLWSVRERLRQRTEMMKIQKKQLENDTER